MIKKNQMFSPLESLASQSIKPYITSIAFIPFLVTQLQLAKWRVYLSRVSKVLGGDYSEDKAGFSFRQNLLVHVVSIFKIMDPGSDTLT